MKQKHPQTPSWPCAEVNRGEPGAMGRGPRSLNVAAAHRPGLLGFGCCSICHLTAMSSAHAELAGAVPTPSGCARAPWPIRTWGEVPGSSDLLSAEGRPGDDGRACQDGRGVYVCRPHRPRAPSTAPRCPHSPAAAPVWPRLAPAINPHPRLLPAHPPGTQRQRRVRTERARGLGARVPRPARQDLQAESAGGPRELRVWRRPKAGNDAPWSPCELGAWGGSLFSSWDLHLIGRGPPTWRGVCSLRPPV